MRRAAILALLFVGMQLVLPLGASNGASQSLLTFGFLILAAYTVGEVARAVRLPKIVGYLIAGVLFGPAVLGTVDARVVTELAPVNQLAVALIAFLAGAELRWQEVRDRWRVILAMLSTELVLSFVGIVLVLVALQRWVPFLSGAPLGAVLSLAALFAAVAIVHSPAVTLALLSETGARGPVARTSLGIVLVADVVVVVLFSGVLALARAFVPPSGAATTASLGLLAWEIGGSVIVGALLGGAVALYLRFVQRELLIFAILVAFFGAEVARLAHVETLLTLLVAGFVTENATRGEGEKLRHAMERSAAPIFVVFFALAGAKIVVGDVVSLFPIVVPIALVRALAIWKGADLGARWSGAGAMERRYAWMGLISQAGVAIGLATVIGEVYPERGPQIRTLLLALIAINETIGPVLFRRALAKSGEIGEGETALVEEPAPAAEPAR